MNQVNGSGKSSLLKIIAGVDKEYEGKVTNNKIDTQNK
jgi:ABC-type transport system involved in cytochrome c biogenesis ATPase subunit